jgi:hypothetical protein
MNTNNMVTHSRITCKALLPYWKEFCDIKRANKAFIDSDKLSKLNRFRARHRLATKLTGIHAEGISEQTLRGYTAGLKLMLAYSAAEILGSALDKPVTQWEIKESQLALSLRNVLNRAGTSRDILFSKGQLKSRLENFLEERTDDVRIAATALRVMVAHGSFTPSGTDSLTIKGAQIVFQLANLILKTAEEHFADYITKEIKKLSSNPRLPMLNSTINL